MNKWTLGIRFRGDLRFFIDDASGRVAVADNSGTYPDQTDDGILWVDADRYLEIDAKMLRIPVIRDRDEDDSGHSWCAVSIRNAERTVAFLAAHYEQLAIDAGEDANGDAPADHWHMRVLRDHLRRVRDAVKRPERNPGARQAEDEITRARVGLAARLVAEIQAEEAEVFRGVDNRHED